MIRDGSTLDLGHRSVTLPVGVALPEPARQKFVEIEVAAVHNPKRKRVSFEVRYRPATGDEVLLGTFALYPPDHPGTFLVATRGSIRPEGTIVVSMVVLDETEPSDQLQVTLKPIAFREQ